MVIHSNCCIFQKEVIKNKQIMLQSAVINSLFSKRHPWFRGCDIETNLISSPLCRTTSVSWLSQSDRPVDLNILVHPIRTSKCVLLRWDCCRGVTKRPGSMIFPGHVLFRSWPTHLRVTHQQTGAFYCCTGKRFEAHALRVCMCFQRRDI